MNTIKNQILTLIIDHSRFFFTTISDMGVYFVNYAEKSEVKPLYLEKKKNKMYLNAQEADFIKEKLISDFSELNLVGLGDFISLILKMDNIIDYALKFIDTLDYIDIFSSNLDLRKKYHNLINNIIKMADIIKESLKLLRDNPIGVIHDINRIHQVYANTEQLIHSFQTSLFNGSDLEMRTLIIIMSSIKILESLIDKMNHVVDTIMVLRYESEFKFREI